MTGLPENSAAKITVHNTTVETNRRRKTCALDGDGGTLTGADMAAKSSRPTRKSQRRFPPFRGFRQSARERWQLAGENTATRRLEAGAPERLAFRDGFLRTRTRDEPEKEADWDKRKEAGHYSGLNEN
jgi:hypothetical protein